MAVIQAIDSILSALAPYAWPVAVVLIFAFLRQPISELIVKIHELQIKYKELTDIFKDKPVNIYYSLAGEMNQCYPENGYPCGK